MQVKALSTNQCTAPPPEAGVVVAVGNRALMNEQQVHICKELDRFMSEMESEARTAIMCSVDGTARAVFAVAGESCFPQCLAASSMTPFCAF